MVRRGAGENALEGHTGGGLVGGLETRLVIVAPGIRVLFVLLAIALVVAGSLVVVPGLARGDGPDRPAPRVSYVVEQGDTLWSIARRVAPGRDPRPVVDGLIEVNDVRGGLQAGQELSIPVPER